MTENITSKPASKPLFATVGAGEAVYAAVVDAITQVRERAAATDVSSRVDEARERFAHVPADVRTQFESLRERLSGLPSELPEDLAELREKFTPEELRALAEKYYAQVLDLYSDLAVRGEETVERLRANHLVEDQIERVETLYKDAASRAEDAFVKVNELIGFPAREEEAEAEPVVEGEVLEVTTETEPVTEDAAPEQAPAKKAPAKKAAAKKVAPKKV